MPADARKRLRARAIAMQASVDGRKETSVLASAVFAVDMLGELAVDLAARPASSAALFEQLEHEGVAPRLVLGQGMLRSSSLLQLPGAVALEVLLALLLTLTEAADVSVWKLRSSSGDLKHIAHAGEFSLHELSTRRVARRLLSSGTPGQHREASVVGVAVNPLTEPVALVARGVRSRTASLALLEAAVPVLTATLARDNLLRRKKQTSHDREALAESRLARLRFDLHDGPQQEAILLAEDMRLLRDHLRPVIDGHPAEERVLAHIDDLVARLVALDGDLRRISAALGAPFAQPVPTLEALLWLTTAFAARTGIEPEISVDHDLADLSESQITTLLMLVREALTNIHKHSKAAHVQISIVDADDQFQVRVTDDGCGFDLERELIRAAREGHIGLASLYQRVRAMGGRVHIDTRPGGPTAVSAMLPANRKTNAKARNRRGTIAAISKPRDGTDMVVVSSESRDGAEVVAVVPKARRSRATVGDVASDRAEVTQEVAAL